MVPLLIVFIEYRFSCKVPFKTPLAATFKSPNMLEVPEVWNVPMTLRKLFVVIELPVVVPEAISSGTLKVEPVTIVTPCKTILPAVIISAVNRECLCAQNQCSCIFFAKSSSGNCNITKKSRISRAEKSKCRRRPRSRAGNIVRCAADKNRGWRNRSVIDNGNRAVQIYLRIAVQNAARVDRKSAVDIEIARSMLKFAVDSKLINRNTCARNKMSGGNRYIIACRRNSARIPSCRRTVTARLNADKISRLNLV